MLMRKTLIFSVVLFALACSFLQASAIIYVPEDYPTIQEAVDHSGYYGRILVSPGTYEEQITIDNKVIEIVGVNYEKTVIRTPKILDENFTHTHGVKCIIAVVNGGDLALFNFTVNGLGNGIENQVFIGLGFKNSSGIVRHSRIVEVQDNPFSNTDHGVGIFALNEDGTDRMIQVRDCVVAGYQKAGMVFNGINTVAHVASCELTGVGPTAKNVQNGIQFAFGARGTVDDCKISQNIYSFEGSTATGILLYDAGITNITNCTSISNNQTGVCYYNSSGKFINNTICADQTAQGFDEDFTGLSINGLNVSGVMLNLLPFGRELGQGWTSSTVPTRIHVIDSYFRADQSGYGTGMRIHSLEDIELEVGVVDCQVSSWERGIEIAGSPTSDPEVTCCRSFIKDNPSYGIKNGSESTVNALFNNWGDPSGPYHPYLNPDGVGNQVSNGVAFNPWQNGEEDFTADNHKLYAVEGGTINFSIDTGPIHALRTYLVLASLSGVSPGTLLPGGQSILPLNWDPFTALALSLLNTPVFVDFLGILDSDGLATATLCSTPIPGVYCGITVYFSYCLTSPYNYTSNPVGIHIIP